MKKTILIYDDDPGTVDTISDNLNHNGFSVLSAYEFLTAKQIAEKSSPDLIILDSMMNSGDKLSAFHSFRNSSVTSSIPIILLVSNIEEIDEIAHLNYMADDFLIKPISPKLLRARIKSFFTKSAYVQKKYEDRMNELKNSISFALPHEFRTSLSGILGFSNIISSYSQKEILSRGEVREIKDMADAINDEGRRLHRLTENFLLYSQIQTMMTSKSPSDTLSACAIENPREIISDIVVDFTSNSSRKTDLITDLDNCNLRISFYYFYKIIFELIDNALKFSDNGTTVEISSKLISGHFVVKITDFGLGMNLEQIKNISAYHQYDRSLHEQQGTGLGLFIAKLLTELHNGLFIIDSVPNKGTTITLDFPPQCIILE